MSFCNSSKNHHFSVDYESLKKSIWWLKRTPSGDFFFSRDGKGVHWWHRNIFLRQTVPAIYDPLRKNCSRVLQRQWFFINFQLWPLVIILSSALWKKTVQEVEVKPLTILKISIKSALMRRSSKDHRPSWLSLSSYGRPLRCGNRCVKRQCTLSNSNLSFL